MVADANSVWSIMLLSMFCGSENPLVAVTAGSSGNSSDGIPRMVNSVRPHLISVSSFSSLSMLTLSPAMRRIISTNSLAVRTISPSSATFASIEADMPISRS